MDDGKCGSEKIVMVGTRAKERSVEKKKKKKKKVIRGVLVGSALRDGEIDLFD